MKKALLVPFIVLVLAGNGFSGQQDVTVKGLRAKSYKSHTRVVIEMDGSVDFTQNRLPNPERLYFDLKKSNLSKKTTSSLEMDGGVVSKIRLAQFDKQTVRLVLEVKSSEKYYAFTLEDPFRMVIDVYAPQSGPLAPGEDRKTANADADKVTTIVIDPGHGGDDPGAIGPNGVQEKDIVLSVGKKLGSLLSEQPGIEVVYTRDRDVFIPLNERTEIANSRKADLFVSIHANASPRKNVRGIETYFLNWTDDKEAIRVAARENKVSFKKMEEMQGDLQMILDDLARKSKNEESMKLASNVQNAIVSALKEKYSRIEDLGVKYALFYVLVGAEMPAVLVEISFISNREEEKRLTQDQYKKRIAEAIAEGINAYMTQSTLFVKKTGRIQS